MTTELRNLGDRLALYTDDIKVYRHFSRRKGFLYAVPYTQRDKLIALDLCFDKGARESLLWALNGNQSGGLKSDG